MDKDKLAEELMALEELSDTEIVHKIADDLLLQYINDALITKLFTKLKKWYS